MMTSALPVPEDTPARMPGLWALGYHHEPASVYYGVWTAYCGEYCYSNPDVTMVRAYYMPCPLCPTDKDG